MTEIRPIRAFTLRRYLELMRLRGFDPVHVLEGTRIDPERLQDRGYLVGSDQRNALIANMFALTGSTGLGFEFGLHTRIAQLGPFGHVLLSSHSIWEQYGLWLQFGEPLLGLPMSVRLAKDEEGLWSATFGDPTASGAAHVFGVEELLMISNKVSQTFTGEPMRLSGLKLDYPAPPHADLYEEIFRCPVEFGCERLEFQAMAPFADETFPGQEDQEVAQTCLSYCGRLLQEINGATSVAARLQNTFAAQLGALPAVEDAARALGMSERTLRRRLAAEGTGFQEVLTRFRRDTAIEYLRDRRMKPKQVGYLLGFRFTSDFRRAFKSWTGRGVGEFTDAA